MKPTKFTITEEEVRELAEEIDIRDLSDVQIQSVLNMVEGDEMSAKDIRSSIIYWFNSWFVGANFNQYE